MKVRALVLNAGAAPEGGAPDNAVINNLLEPAAKLDDKASVEIGGKRYAVADLLASQTKAATLESQVKELSTKVGALSEVESALKTSLGLAEASEAQQRADLTKLYMRAGLSPADAAAQAEKHFASDDTPDDDTALGGASERPVPKPDAKTLLKEAGLDADSLSALTSDFGQITNFSRAIMNSTLTKEVDTSVQGHTKLGSYLDALTETSPDVVKDVKADIRTEILNQTRSLLREAMSTESDFTTVYSQIPALTKKATDAVAAKYLRLVGNGKMLGRSRGIADFQESLETTLAQRVERPDPAKIKDPVQLQIAARAFLKNKLAEALQNPGRV